MANSNFWFESIQQFTDFTDLIRRIIELQGPGTTCLTRQSSSHVFRGVPNEHWRLKPTLLHREKVNHDDRGLDKERQLVESFKVRAWRFLGTTERAFLGITSQDRRKGNPADGELDWTDESIWSAIAVARHYGVHTRLLDWTESVLVAAFFAASSEHYDDGAIWWFDQRQFENQLGEKWDAWRVPMRKDRPAHRAIARAAFCTSAPNWLSKIHHQVPFRRMEIQRGFFTACGRIDYAHDLAIDEHYSITEVPRGRLIVKARFKKQLLDWLEDVGIHATTLDYPGADLAAQAANK